MRFRFRFKKTGRLKYIGHLDLLNIFNRAIKSAKLPVMYSKGFNPHMLVVFAAPLPLGITSIGEYVDIDFEESFVAEEAINRLNGKMPEGLAVTDFFYLEEPYMRVPSLVVGARYSITGIGDISADCIQSLMRLETIEVMKKTKRKHELTNIRPDIISVEKTDLGISAVLACGSQRNLKASLLAETVISYGKTAVPLYKAVIERNEIYGAPPALKKDETPVCFDSVLPLSTINAYKKEGNAFYENPNN